MPAYLGTKETLQNLYLVVLLYVPIQLVANDAFYTSSCHMYAGAAFLNFLKWLYFPPNSNSLHHICVVEPEGVEPSIPPCKGGSFPLAYGPIKLGTFENLPCFPLERLLYVPKYLCLSRVPERRWLAENVITAGCAGENRTPIMGI